MRTGGRTDTGNGIDLGLWDLCRAPRTLSHYREERREEGWECSVERLSATLALGWPQGTDVQRAPAVPCSLNSKTRAGPNPGAGARQVLGLPSEPLRRGVAPGPRQNSSAGTLRFRPDTCFPPGVWSVGLSGGGRP